MAPPDFPQQSLAELSSRPVRASLPRPGQALQLLTGPVKIGTSIGIAIYPDDAVERDMLLKKADVAMYGAKHAGGTGFEFCAP